MWVETLAPDLLRSLSRLIWPGTLAECQFPHCPVDEVKGVVVTDQGQMKRTGFRSRSAMTDAVFPLFLGCSFGRRAFSQKTISDIRPSRRLYLVTPLKSWT